MLAPGTSVSVFATNPPVHDSAQDIDKFLPLAKAIISSLVVTRENNNTPPVPATPASNWQPGQVSPLLAQMQVLVLEQV